MSTNTKKEQLSPKQLRAVALWFSPIQKQEIAKQIGVTKETLSRWQQDTRFQTAIKEREAELKAKATSILADGVADAAYGLVTLARRLDRQACVDVLKAARVYVEKQEVDQTITDNRVLMDL